MRNRFLLDPPSSDFPKPSKATVTLKWTTTLGPDVWTKPRGPTVHLSPVRRPCSRPAPSPPPHRWPHDADAERAEAEAPRAALARAGQHAAVVGEGADHAGGSLHGRPAAARGEGRDRERGAGRDRDRRRGERPRHSALRAWSRNILHMNLYDIICTIYMYIYICMCMSVCVCV